jgi:small subunit ribosomal protein S1
MEDSKDRPDASGEDDFAALFAASEKKTAERRRISTGDVVRGRVIALAGGNAFVEIGGKGEAIIELAEFRDAETGEIQLGVGDEVEATVVDDGQTSGTVLLKRTVGRGGHVPGELEQALTHGIAVEGLVTGENKGGFDVQFGTVRAFCPGSQIDRRRGEPASYLNQRFRFRVTKIESGGRNIVVSRRMLLDEEAAEQAERTWAQVQVGAVLQGKVTSVRDFGAFVDLGGVEGLVHVSELGHGRVSHPSDVLQPDQVVEVKVLKVERAGEGGRPRVGLSLRALAPDPWDTARQQFPVGSTIPGIVRRLENFGAFVEIGPGIDGLVHVSKLVLDRRISHPRQAVNIGDNVEVTVLAVDETQRRISLSMVERAKQERDTQEASARTEESATLGQVNERKSLGSFADLLAAKKRDQE